jgi:hypothetical protein
MRLENGCLSDKMLGMSVDTLTDFLRQPKKALKKVDKEDVVLARRGKASIRISLESRNRADVERNELASHLLADAVSELPDVSAHFTVILEKRFPWARFLPVEDRERFAHELVDTIQACASLGKLAKIEELFRSWKATADVYADPELASRLKGPFDETSNRVRRP